LQISHARQRRYDARMNASDPHAIRDLASLEALFGNPGDAAIQKELTFIHPIYRQWIEESPFAVLATLADDGLDASPRGDPASLVRIADEHTILLPERRGNNRIDSLRNIVRDSRVALLFLIPGVGETLRVNGHASISVDPELMRSMSMDGIPPKCVIVIRISSVFFQCARAMQRSKLWGYPELDRSRIPTPGAMLSAVTNSTFDGVSYDRELPARQKSTLY
jgi:PPOX class probable FMN-dependent enzyme